MREKIVLIGAGSAVFTRGLVADILDRGWDCDLALVDTDPGALVVAEHLASKMIDARGACVSLEATLHRRDVLKGATVVICTISVGGRRAWEKDVFIPRRHGIFQPVGDTVMPGGTSRALRMIPAMVAIAEDVLDCCPDALFFNYGNPMAAVCRGVRKVTGAPIIGLCHGVCHVASYLADVLGADRGRLTYTAIGMNHLTWFTEVRINGQDVIPALTDIAETDPAGQDSPVADNPFSWQLLELFQAFPAVLDRHVTEFFPNLFRGQGSYFGKTLGVDVFSFEETVERGDTTFARMTGDAMSAGPLPTDYFRRSAGEHEQVIDIITDIRRDAGTVYSANLPNRGQLPGVPDEVIVECPAMAVANGLKPLTQNALGPGVYGTLASRFQWVETIVDAARLGNRRLLAQALLLDGAVTSIQQAAELADDLLEAHAGLLPAFRE